MPNIETRIEQIEFAHRALAARSEALFQVAKVMFALVPTNGPLLETLLNRVESIIMDHMQQLEWDADFQEQVAESMQELREVIRAADEKVAMGLRNA